MASIAQLGHGTGPAPAQHAAVLPAKPSVPPPTRAAPATAAAGGALCESFPAASTGRDRRPRAERVDAFFHSLALEQAEGARALAGDAE